MFDLFFFQYWATVNLILHIFFSCFLHEEPAKDSNVQNCILKDELPQFNPMKGFEPEYTFCHWDLGLHWKTAEV